MGLFTRSSKVKKKQSQVDGSQFHQSSPSLLGPPNVYAPPRKQQQRQQQQPRSHGPAQAQNRPQPQGPYAQHHASRSQPQLQPQFQPQPQQHQQQPFHPAGYLPPPPGWTPQPVIVNQHYYLGGQPQAQQSQGQLQAPVRVNQPSGSGSGNSPYSLDRLAGSVANLARDVVPVDALPGLRDGDGLAVWHGCGAQLASSTAAVYDQICGRVDDVLTLIDRESLTGCEKGLFSCHPGPAASSSPPAQGSLPSGAVPPAEQDRGGAAARPSKKKSSGRVKPKKSGTLAAAVVSGTYFSKVELYANSKLPPNLPPLALHIPTWPLLCLAAQYSQRVYDAPRGAERDTHVSADWRTGSKAMCIKSVPMDHMNTIVFAIRGTASFMDWAVNLNDAPVSPAGFLDDPGNLCHAGFLSVARRMAGPVAARLRHLLREDPARARYSLLITGHSAGGAIAALLYAHMLAQDPAARSDLSRLSAAFRRVHCVTFGTPPVSLLPLQRPDRPHLRKSLFLSLVNEGDPVVRADKAYVWSLLELLAAAPPPAGQQAPSRDKKIGSSISPRSKTKTTPKAADPQQQQQQPRWEVPPCALSNAGRIVVLRSGDPAAQPKDRKTVRERLDEGVVAHTAREDQLRGLVWGDPVCHLMSLYAGRVEVLAVGAVTGKGR